MNTRVVGLFADITKALCEYLNDALSKFSDDWWEKYVLPSLSFQQQRLVEQRNLRKLADLDLAALLRIFDYNWHVLSSQQKLSREDRHYVKEAQTIRNRWAHAGSDGFDEEDIYRDLDTLQRLADLIHAGEDVIHRIREVKRAIFTRDSDEHAAEVRQKPEDSFEFERGQVVALRSDPAVRGAVIDILPGEPENRFVVFQNTAPVTYYASQLQAVAESPAALISLHEFHAGLTALQILHPGLSTLYSLHAAKIDYIPYQFRPVLKFIRSDRPRLLIADGVGVGKTIEAGLILRELQARHNVRSVLIICPKALVTEQKWQREMKRFDEQFTQLDGKTLQYCIQETHRDGDWPEQYTKAILPYSLLSEQTVEGSSTQRGRNSRCGLADLDPPPHFDLVIVDEAHHIRNTETFSYKGVSFFCQHADAVVFLTATPIQLGSRDLFVLLQLLRPDVIIDQAGFKHIAEPNPYINRALDLIRGQPTDWRQQALEALEQAASTAWGRSMLQENPDFLRIRSHLMQDEIPPDERIAIMHDLEEMHTFAGMINRTRRRDIGEFTVRTPETVTVEFTPQQRSLHDRILEIQAAIFVQLHEDRSINFLMSTIRRQTASCLFGLVPLLREILTRHLDELVWDEIDDACEPDFGQRVDSIEAQVQEVLEMAERLNLHDPKLEALCRIIEDKQRLSNNKIMLFSSFRHTLSYLFRQLQQRGFRVGLIHGGTPDEERMVLRNRFQADRECSDAFDVLLFSEVGCEGLDYQFCDCIVNYDLPWNPMRVEQRIGRIDRHGQTSEKVVIYNFVTPGTVDADIYERCLIRIGVFNRELGGSEEILGEITREIRDVAENLQLTEQERQLKLQQIADNNIRLIQEQESLETKQMELFGLRIPAVQMQQEIEEMSSYWLSPSALQNLVTRYLQAVSSSGQAVILGEKALKTLRLSQETRTLLLRDFEQLPRQRSIMYREWEKWLKGEEQYLPITFEAACASEHPEAAFILPVHPLVRQAAQRYAIQKRVMTACVATYDALAPGNYAFAVYQWQHQGIRQDQELCVIGENRDLSARLIELLQNGEPLSLSQSEMPDAKVFEALEAQHYQRWNAAKAEHQEKTARIAEYKRESLTTSHQARMNLLREQLSQAANPKIQRMKQAQIANAERDFASHRAQLEHAVTKADLISQLVAFGVVRVTTPTEDK